MNGTAASRSNKASPGDSGISARNKLRVIYGLSPAPDAGAEGGA